MPDKGVKLGYCPQPIQSIHRISVRAVVLGSARVSGRESTPHLMFTGLSVQGPDAVLKGQVPVWGPDTAGMVARHRERNSRNLRNCKPGGLVTRAESHPVLDPFPYRILNLILEDAFHP